MTSLATENPAGERAALARLHACVMADDTLAARLAGIEDINLFVDCVMRDAASLGIPLAAETVRQKIRPDPLGLAQWSAAGPQGTEWPSCRWLPTHVATHCDPICVDWAWFDDAALTEPFFESAVHRAMGRPFNRLFRYRMALDDLVANVPSPLSLPPNGFIFHMSRCGSTLAAQMLATRERSIVISEAPPIDAVVQLARATPHWPAERHAEFLRAIIAAYGRRRRGDENQFFVKLDSWHTLALPLFRRAFAGVPWLFLYRNPVEVLVSQMRQRGSQMVPEIMPPAFYGIDNADGPQGVEYCARVLNKICTAALTGCIDDGGLPVNYDELPGAVESRILPHFGQSATPPERDAMALAARRDAKNPTFDFSRDTEAKQGAASDAMRAAAERHLGDVYRKLETLRAAS